MGKYLDYFIKLLQSRTVLAALVSAVASLLAVFDVSFDASPEQMDPIYNGIAAVGAMLAVLFRGTASKKIGGGQLE